MGLHHRNLKDDTFNYGSLKNAGDTVGFLGVERIVSDTTIKWVVRALFVAVLIVVAMTIGIRPPVG